MPLDLDDERQPSFADVFAPPLFDATQPTPDGIVGPHGNAAAMRFNVYRNNVTVSLIDALAAIYPAVQRITGVEFFRAMARFHIRATPPTSPLLFEYGRDFPAFIESYQHAKAMPWLADVARIERAWLDAYHAADAFAARVRCAGKDPIRAGRPDLHCASGHAHRAFGLSGGGDLRHESRRGSCCAAAIGRRRGRARHTARIRRDSPAAARVAPAFSSPPPRRRDLGRGRIGRLLRDPRLRSRGEPSRQ